MLFFSVLTRFLFRCGFVSFAASFSFFFRSRFVFVTFRRRFLLRFSIGSPDVYVLRAAHMSTCCLMCFVHFRPSFCLHIDFVFAAPLCRFNFCSVSFFFAAFRCRFCSGSLSDRLPLRTAHMPTCCLMLFVPFRPSFGCVSPSFVWFRDAVSFFLSVFSLFFCFVSAFFFSLFSIGSPAVRRYVPLSFLSAIP